MKKLLLSLSVVLAGATAQGQNLISQNFDVFPAVAAPGASGQWVQSNQSTPVGASTWAQGGGTAFAGGGQAGGATSFTLCNFLSVAAGQSGTISNWLFAPVVDLQNGDVITFWARQGGTAPAYADRMQMRIATDWSDFSALPTGGATDVGDFAIVATDINPNLTQAGFPLVWTQYTYTVTGLTGVVPCRIAFRYFVTNGGETGANSNIIAVDTFSVDRPLSTEGFFASNYAVSPNPASSVLNINAKTGAALSNIQLTDVNGRIVKTINAGNVSETQINISDLNSGVYFLKISSDLGVGTSKIIKN
jgi:hypothetical protein